MRSYGYSISARVCVIHKNIPNMLTQITTAFSADGINIENLANGSKDEIAYTIVETAQSVGSEVLSRVEQIEGVIRVLCY